MRISFVGTRGIPVRYGGFETAVEEISTRLVARGHEATVYCRHDGSDSSTETSYKGVRRVSLPSLPLRAAETLSHTLLSLLHVLFVRPADVVLVFNPANGPLCWLLKIARKPFAINVDGLEWKRAKWSAWGQRYLRLAAGVSARIAPVIIADSHGIQDYYREHFERDSTFVPYGAYEESSRDPGLLKEFQLTAGDYFLIVARLEPENNTELIVRAFEGVETEKKLVIVGGVSYQSEYVEKLKSLSSQRVVFLGGIYDQIKLTEIVCNCFAYVHGHEVGGTNPILLKALGCGCCVLYLDNAFNREVVGPAGLGFEKDVEALRARLQELAADPSSASEYRKLSRVRIQGRYDWDRVADGYENIALELIKKD